MSGRLLILFSLTIIAGLSASLMGEVRSVRYHGIRPTDPQGLVGLRNPERGFRTETAIAEGVHTTNVIFGLSDSIKNVVPPNLVYTNDRWILENKMFEPYGITLAQTYCYLTEYRNRPISKKKLDLLQKSLNCLRQNGMKAILRFAYAKDMKGKTSAKLKWILRHIDQLAPIIQKNVDVIYSMEAGFIGAWGEWHSDQYISPTDYVARAKIVKKLLDILPEGRMVQIRTPQARKYLLDTVIFKGQRQQYAARTGFNNDGFFAGKTEGGTWTEPPYYGNPGNPEFDAVTKESPYMIVGGELFWSNLVQEPGKQVQAHAADDGLAVAIRMRLHHYSLFSIEHSYSVREGKNYAIDKWIVTPITKEQLEQAKMPISDGYFKNQFGQEVKRTQFEYIRDHLGYRLELQKAAFPDKIKSGDILSSDFEVINRGFSTLHNPRKVYVVLIDINGRVTAFDTRADVRKFQPFKPGDANYTPLKHHFGIKVKLPAAIKPGWYQLGLWLPDPYDSIHLDPRYAIRLANRDTLWWTNDKGKYGINLFGTVEVLQ